MAIYEDKSWERLESVIKWSQLSTNRFAKQIGLERAESLYQIERGRNKLSQKLAERIVQRYPCISYSWLLSGVGEMLGTAKCNEQIDYYNLDCECEIAKREVIKPVFKLTLPQKVCADFAMNYCGAAMGDTIPYGAIVMLKLTQLDQVIFGNEYLVVSRHITALRVVRRNDNSDDTIRLVAQESQRFDDLEIKRGDIEAIYKVAAKLIIN